MTVIKLLFLLKLTLHSETQEVQDYILDYDHNGVLYEIHLIDSPGFEDGALIDTDVLSRIADYVNMIYKLNQRLAGVLYLHDITKTKVGWTGKRNLRMLENMIGTDAYSHCTLVTTKWGCTTNSKDEETRGTTIETEMRAGNFISDVRREVVRRVQAEEEGLAAQDPFATIETEMRAGKLISDVRREVV